MLFFYYCNKTTVVKSFVSFLLIYFSTSGSFAHNFLSFLNTAEIYLLHIFCVWTSIFFFFFLHAIDNNETEDGVMYLKCNYVGLYPSQMDKELGFTTRSKPRFTGKVRLCIARYRYANKIPWKNIFIVTGNKREIKHLQRQELHCWCILYLLTFWSSQFQSELNYRPLQSSSIFWRIVNAVIKRESLSIPLWNGCGDYLLLSRSFRLKS